MRRAVLLVVLAALAAGCGDDGEQAQPAAAPPAVTTEATDTGGVDTLPVIVVETPLPGDRVTSPVTVSGTANVFEANVTVVVEDAQGNELARDFTTATCGTGCRGDYSIELEFTVSEEQEGTIVVHDDDAAGTGTPPHVARVPVTLSP